MGYKTADLHSNHSQDKRERIFSNFRAGQINVLVVSE